MKISLKNRFRILKFSAIVPLITPLFLLLFFGILTKGLFFTPFNINILINQSIILAVIATGAVFIYSMGYIDISVGTITCFTGIISIMLANKTGSPLIMLLSSLFVAIIISLINGISIALFKLPSFIVTLVMMNILNALINFTLGLNSMIAVSYDFSYLDTFEIKMLTLIFMAFLSVLIFNYTPIGRGNKLIGGNPLASYLSGISISRNTILSFIFHGIGIGLGTFILLIRTNCVSYQTGTSYPFDVIIALVLGGMPITGGPKTRITAGLIGAFTITTLNNGLTMLGISIGLLQVLKGLIFLVVLSILTISNRDKLLPR